MSTNPFGGGQTFTGQNAPSAPKAVAGQFGGPSTGGVGLISISGFYAAIEQLVSDPLHIQYASGSARVISREQGSNEEDPAGILRLRAAIALFDWQYRLVDSPPIEIRANLSIYGVSGPSAHTAMAQNVEEYFTAYLVAMAGSFTDKINFLINRHGLTGEQAAARLGVAGYVNPADEPQAPAPSPNLPE